MMQVMPMQSPNPSIPSRRAPLHPHPDSVSLQPPEEPEVKPEPGPIEDFERTPSGRIRRTSAQVAVFHLQEIAEDELAKDWTKRRMKDDLVPETKRVRSLCFSSSLAVAVHGDPGRQRGPSWLRAHISHFCALNQLALMANLLLKSPPSLSSLEAL